MRLLLLSIIINAKRSTLRITSVCFQQTTFFVNAKTFIKKHKKAILFLKCGAYRRSYNLALTQKSCCLQTNAIIYGVMNIKWRRSAEGGEGATA
jgi:hypothetical protein